MGGEGAKKSQISQVATIGGRHCCKRTYPVLQLAGSDLGLCTHLFVKVPRSGDSEMTFSVFESSYATCYYQSNHSKVEAILL